MKYIIIMSLVLILYSNAYSQGDTLQINLKSGTIEKIALKEIQKIKFENATSVDEIQQKQPEAKNFPNPFSEVTTITFEIETPGTVEVKIYDNAGNLLRTITCESCPAGKNQMNWDIKNQRGELVPSGVYYYEFRADSKTIAKKMIKVK